ncbi:MAG: hypothetical protein KKH74_14010 [Gammaproteobacteria bacterium]|nr:hypothetical protein [Gammaproteobacteria bacterium]MBU1733558.1 hypothetical protein [Gammaproteobacteria bacterium]MBU1891726.1 hypothetical protein [Gammaproteobacteria bacterium]
MNDLVPTGFIGVWQRISMEAKGRPADITTQAYWIQTSALQADMRVPAGRPDFSGKASLAEYSVDDLLWLARQQGIAGMTLAGGELVHRRRQIDYQPTRGRDNTHRMHFEGELLVDENLQGSVVEKWRRLAGAEGGVITLRLLEEAEADGRIVPRKGYLLVVSDYFLFVRDRPEFTRQAASLEDLFEAQDLECEEMVPFLDCEFSFGRRSGGAQPWIIELSTLPYREGKALFSPGQFEALRAGGNALVQRGRGRNGLITRRWSIHEWTEPATA